MSLQSLSLTLSLRAGPIGRQPRLIFALTLDGMIGLPQVECGGTVAVADRGFSDFKLTQDQFLRLCGALEETGIETRVPKVDGKMDTSDSSARILMHAALEKGSRTLDVDLLSSSYEGPDAPALRKFMGLLLDAADVTDLSIRHDLCGG